MRCPPMTRQVGIGSPGFRFGERVEVVATTSQNRNFRYLPTRKANLLQIEFGEFAQRSHSSGERTKRFRLLLGQNASLTCVVRRKRPDTIQPKSVCQRAAR